MLVCSFNSSGANTILPLQLLPRDRDVSSLAYVVVDSHDAFIYFVRYIYLNIHKNIIYLMITFTLTKFFKHDLIQE